MSITCTVTTPERLVYEGKADLIVVPASDGELGILPRHAPLMALLGTGEMRIKKAAGSTDSVFIRGGFVQVVHDQVNVLATDAELAGQIDPSAAQAEVEKVAAVPAGTRRSIEERAQSNERLRAAKIKARLARGKAGA
ncbi:MAG: ATP synthase F1 subunit epsilon [Planctomycetes bacterium]|nr:ATP synthase F1 subunit epsilon [Planctomycetota bacterium]